MGDGDNWNNKLKSVKKWWGLWPVMVKLCNLKKEG